MSKRFRPPSSKNAFEGPRRVVDASVASPDAMRNALVEAGVLDVYLRIHPRWMSFVERKLTKCEGVNDFDDHPANEPQRERARVLCQWLGVLYVGKRLGTFTLLLDENDGHRIDGSTLAVSSALTELADCCGSRKAESIYRRLEMETERAVKKGRSISRS